MYSIELQWKEFNLSLPTIKTWVDVNIATACVGMSANSKLEIHFESEPSQEEKDNLQVYWDALTEESDEATAYQTAEEIEADRLADIAAKKASAKAKLVVLGLTEEEADAALGLE